MSELLYKAADSGCCCDCCCCPTGITAERCCCRRGYLIIYVIANEGDEKAGWSLSTLTVDRCGIVSVDIVEPVDAHESRWEVFWFYRLPGGGTPHRVEICGDAADWVEESIEDNNCRTEQLP